MINLTKLIALICFAFTFSNTYSQLPGSQDIPSSQDITSSPDTPPSPDKWDLSIGVHANFTQATGPALRYLKEKTLNEGEVSNDIVGYENRFRFGQGLDLGVRYKAFEKVFIGLGVSLTQMRMMPTRRSISESGTTNQQNLEQNLTHRLNYLAPRIEAGGSWGKFSLSGGLAANVLLGGRTYNGIITDLALRGLTGYRVGVPINTEKDVFFLDPSSPDTYFEVENASSYGFKDITYSASTELRIQPFSETRGPYIKLGYQFTLNPYKSEVSPFWDTFNNGQPISETEQNLVSRWHSFTVGMGWVIL